MVSKINNYETYKNIEIEDTPVFFSLFDLETTTRKEAYTTFKEAQFTKQAVNCNDNSVKKQKK